MPVHGDLLPRRVRVRVTDRVRLKMHRVWYLVTEFPETAILAKQTQGKRKANANQTQSERKPYATANSKQAQSKRKASAKRAKACTKRETQREKRKARNTKRETQSEKCKQATAVSLNVHGCYVRQGRGEDSPTWVSPPAGKF